MFMASNLWMTTRTARTTGTTATCATRRTSSCRRASSRRRLRPMLSTPVPSPPVASRCWTPLAPLLPSWFATTLARFAGSDTTTTHPSMPINGLVFCTLPSICKGLLLDYEKSDMPSTKNSNHTWSVPAAGIICFRSSFLRVPNNIADAVMLATSTDVVELGLMMGSGLVWGWGRGRESLLFNDRALEALITTKGINETSLCRLELR
mmetsp:Transcript_88680/g.236045  ORF Transcript_88680/g.236045 Transcript_88680/m.236045 type:complete len:207 (-) Transcript_88680:41-661(-)